MEEVRITFAQLGATKKKEDIKNFYETLDKLKGTQTDIIMFPEYFPIWPPLSKYEEEVRKRAKEFAREQEKMVIYGCARDNKHNSLIVVMPSGEGKVYDKRIRFAYEKKFKKGLGDLIFNYKGLRLGFFICYELFFPELIRHLAKQDIDLLLGISKNPSSFRKTWKAVVKTRAFENMLPIAVCSNYAKKMSKGPSCSFAVIPPSEVIANPPVKNKTKTFKLKINEAWKKKRKKESPIQKVGKMFKRGKYLYPGDIKQVDHILK